MAGGAAVVGSSNGSWHALLAGATGATGRHLLAYLLSNDRVAAVTVIGRREVVFPPDNQPSASHLQKLQYKNLIDLTEIESLHPSQLPTPPYHLAFCCLGTTRADAGSSQGFRKIDHDCVTYFGKLAKECGVQHMQLLSSVGANKDSMILYIRTKGETEEYYRSLDFNQLTIVRPPLLDRGADARFVEKLLKWFLPVVKVRDVAYAMMRQAEDVLISNKQGEAVVDTTAIKKFCRE